MSTFKEMDTVDYLELFGKYSLQIVSVFCVIFFLFNVWQQNVKHFQKQVYSISVKIYCS